MNVGKTFATRRGATAPLSVAPMMDRTDRHFRAMLRLISRHTLLYSEMVTTGAILHGDKPRHLDFSAPEHPIALQLGGDDPRAMAECARIAEQWGYDEVNINVGCPSDRVQNGHFGACLMAHPETVAQCVSAMRDAVSIPVTVKHRIGIDKQDSYEFMNLFVTQVLDAGADRVSVHARIAWLQGLSPKENREVPPLRYDDIYRLKDEHPDVAVELNGGVRTLDQVEEHLEHVDAVMLGRAAWDEPYLFVDADRRFFGDDSPRPTRHQVARMMRDYAQSQMGEGTRVHHITKRMLTLFTGVPGARRWRRILTEGAAQGRSIDVIDEAL
ncbi:MAG: tRNA dihydrouridine(20/20a) synthase DusA, partial [Myxococcota bacterium]